MSIVNGVSGDKPQPWKKTTSPRTSGSRTRPTTCAAGSGSTASCTCAIRPRRRRLHHHRQQLGPAHPLRAGPGPVHPRHGQALGPGRRVPGHPRRPDEPARLRLRRQARHLLQSVAGLRHGRHERPGPEHRGSGRPVGPGIGPGRRDRPTSPGPSPGLGQKTIEEFRKAQEAEAKKRKRRPRARRPRPGRVDGRPAADRPQLRQQRLGPAHQRRLQQGGEELTGSPALADIALGKGHVVLFSFNPAWRSQTHGSYFFIFNALLNWKDLGAKPK